MYEIAISLAVDSDYSDTHSLQKLRKNVGSCPVDGVNNDLEFGPFYLILIDDFERKNMVDMSFVPRVVNK